MLIFYVGELWNGGTCLHRKRALERLGHEVIGFDISKYKFKYRILRSVEHRFNFGPYHYLLNAQIVKTIKNLKGIDIFWVDKGRWIFPSLLVYIKKKFKGIKLIHYTPDYLLTSQRSRYFIKSIPIYDLCVTTKSAEVEIYKQLGGRNVMFVFSSFCPEVHRPGPPVHNLISDICFVGHCEPHYINYLRYLKELKALILIRGDGWLSKRKLFNNNWLIAGSAWEEDYAKVLRSSKISLGFLSRYSKKIPDFHTSRSIEIPACGSFLLAERTHEHKVLFEEGKEADFFNEGEELIDKAKFYLKNENVRNTIAKAGYEKVYKLGLRNDDVMKKALDKLIFI